MALIEEYKAHTANRAKLGIPPLPLTPAQVSELVELLKADSIVEEEYLLDLLKNHIYPGVDDSAYVKAAFLNAILTDDAHCKAIDKVDAIKILGSMMGGFNVGPLIEALKSPHVEVAQAAADELKNTILVYDAFNNVKDLMDEGNPYAKEVIESWANAEWFLNKPELEKEITLTVYKVPGETNTDDLFSLVCPSSQVVFPF